MQCPKCKHQFKDEDRAKGGRNSRRTITPEQQMEMQVARAKKRAEKASDEPSA